MTLDWVRSRGHETRSLQIVPFPVSPVSPVSPAAPPPSPAASSLAPRTLVRIVAGVLGVAGLGTALGAALVACGGPVPALEGASLASSLRVHGASESAVGPRLEQRNAKTKLSSAVASPGKADALRLAAEIPAGTDFATNLAQPQNLGPFSIGSGGSGPEGSVCPRNMAAIQVGGRSFCIDRYEASLVEVLPGGLERPFPHTQNPGSVSVRAVSEPHVFPQAYISGREAATACEASGKRLCKAEEWRGACRGSAQNAYPYGATRQAGTCNDHGRAPLGVVYKGDPKVYGSWEKMNDPALNQVEGSLARSGEHEACASEAGVYDMVGNVHEWIDDPKGTFVGGYYLDTEKNGSGCGYTTDRHGTFYHDYSTGFRCCADRP